MSWWDDITSGAGGSVGGSGGAGGSVGGSGGAGGSYDPWAGVNSGASGSVGIRGGAQGGPRAGTPHPDYPGCLWDPQFNTYVCDDGYTVDGEIPFNWDALTSGAAGGAASVRNQQQLPPPPGRYPNPPGNNVSPYLLIGVVVLLGVVAMRK